jgi:hypothetical protein
VHGVTCAWRKPGVGWRLARIEDLFGGRIVAVHPLAQDGGWWKPAQILSVTRESASTVRVQVSWLPRRFGSVTTGTFLLHRVRLLPDAVAHEIREAEIFPALPVKGGEAR